MAARPAGEALERREHGDQRGPSSSRSPSRMTIRSALSVTNALVAPRWRYGRAAGRLLAEGVDVRHDVVAEAPLVPAGGGQVGVVEVGAHLGQRLLGDVEPELALGLRQGEPEPAPEPDAVRLAPQRLHRGRGVAGAERRAPAVVGHRNDEIGEGDLAVALDVDPDDLARSGR